MYNFCIISETKIRVDIYLSALFSDFSRSYIQKMIDKGQVSVNKIPISKNVKLQPKDEIHIIIKTEKLDIQPQEMSLDIIFEDENILIINKEAGINVHPVPGEGGKENTLVNGILYHCRKKVEEGNSRKVEEEVSLVSRQENHPSTLCKKGVREISHGKLKTENGQLPSINGVERPGIVHRLDKDTSGIILIAKTDTMMQYLSKIIKNREIKKEYIAVVSGIVKDQKIKIESYIGRDRFDRKKMTTFEPINPKIALTEAKVLGYIDEKYSVLEVKIHTGRTHQIRVHLASIGFPIIGDKVYGNQKINKEVYEKYSLTRQALHANTLEFELYGRKVEFTAGLKSDMKQIITSI